MSVAPDSKNPPSSTWGTAVAKVAREHRLLVALVMGFVATGYALEFGLQLDGMVHLRFWYRFYTMFAVLVASLFLCVQILRKRTHIYLNRERILGLLVVLVLAAPFGSTFASLKQVLPRMDDFGWDPLFMQWDQWLHGGNHAYELIEGLVANPILIRLLDGMYLTWFPLFFGMSVYMGWSSRRRLRMRFLLSVVLTWFLLGTLMTAVMPSAGPCFYGELMPDQPDPYAPLMDQLFDHHHEARLYSIGNQQMLWHGYTHDVWRPFGGIAAMPSLHVGFAVLVAIVGWRVKRSLGVLFILYALVTLIGSVALAWHYAIDGYVSAILVFAIWTGTGYLVPRDGCRRSTGRMIAATR